MSSKYMPVSSLQNVSRCNNQQSMPATGANNVYFRDGCPALMSDGRFVTYYNSTNELTESIRRVNGFQSENQFRTFMQKNGSAFMAADRNASERANTCSPTTACSEGWNSLWTQKGGYWGNNYSN